MKNKFLPIIILDYLSSLKEIKPKTNSEVNNISQFVSELRRKNNILIKFR